MSGSTDLERVASTLDPAMVIVTAVAGERKGGCLVGFHTQVSIDPPLMLVCISRKNHTHEVAEDASVLAVHVVAEKRHGIAELFGGETDDEVNKFERCGWTEGPQGVPLLDDCPVRFVGRILQTARFGDHTGFLLAPVSGEDSPDSEETPLRLEAAEEIDPGHEA
jgi:flavin reductase (DIM6/NTAB) family NADH-FMN oxidoreductase RutF